LGDASLLMLQVDRRRLLPYLYAIVVIVGATALRIVLIPFLGTESFPFITFVPAVIVCAWRCGLGPSICAAVLSILVRGWVLSQYRASEIPNVAAFIVMSGLIIALVESNRRARETLEDRVQERTKAFHDVSARLLQIQDTERRRIARELHDSVGQALAAIAINLGTLRKTPQNAAVAKTLEDTDALTREAIRQTRSLSHLLHPPLLEELGLRVVLEEYVKGFSNRSGIRVSVEAPRDFPRLSEDTEIGIFRMVQECLTNIHRHSGSSSAVIQLTPADSHLRITIRDFGKGIPKGIFSNGPGVGLRGMSERISQLGGVLEVHSESPGTTVTASLPLPNGPQVSSERSAW
jgi:signal transduction histidine kinase